MSYTGYAIYKTAQTQSDDPRDVEYRLLAQVTAGLMQARENPNELKLRLEAVLRQRAVWSAFRVDLVGDDNKLPKALRASLISVSLWIEKECQRILSGETNDMDALIDINRNIMKGLKPELSADPSAHAQETMQADQQTAENPEGESA